MKVSRFTVVMVNYRTLDEIASVLRSGVLNGHDVIVVDNADDPDGVRALCDEHGATAVLLPANLGFAAAVNRAVQSIRSPEHPWLLLNPDVDATSADLLRLSEGLAEADAVAPLLRQPNGQLQVGAAGGRLSLASVAGYFLFLTHALIFWQGVFLTRRQSLRASEVGWLCMACMAAVPDAFQRFGHIPEDELVYAEDLAWGTSATSRGARLRLLNDVVVTHRGGASGESARWAGSVERLCRRRLGRVRGVLAVLSIRCGLVARRLLGRRVV